MIRYAKEQDIPKIEDLLSQVDLVHHNGRPDIFKIGRKYSAEELKVLLKDSNRPILVSVDENDQSTHVGWTDLDIRCHSSFRLTVCTVHTICEHDVIDSMSGGHQRIGLAYGFQIRCYLGQILVIQRDDGVRDHGEDIMHPHHQRIQFR